jgi:hypothetical protein
MFLKHSNFHLNLFLHNFIFLHHFLIHLDLLLLTFQPSLFLTHRGHKLLIPQPFLLRLLYHHRQYLLPPTLFLTLKVLYRLVTDLKLIILVPGEVMPHRGKVKVVLVQFQLD